MNWKRGLMYGSFTAGAILFLTGRRPIGLAVAGVGLVALAAEHPEKLEDIWRRMPDYIDKGSRWMDRAASVLELLGERSSAGLRNIAAR